MHNAETTTGASEPHHGLMEHMFTCDKYALMIIVI